jgi:hypothetical protein
MLSEAQAEEVAKARAKIMGLFDKKPEGFWLRVCWAIYSIVFDAARFLFMPLAAIGWAIWDAAKASWLEFREGL